MLASRPLVRVAAFARHALLVSMLLAGSFAPLSGQEVRAIPRISEAIVLDGRIEEAAWQAVAPLPTVVFAPTYGADPTQRTEIRLAHDGTYLYASARMFESDPTAIRADALVRDDTSEDDFFNLVVDSFDDHENALWFLVTPMGNRVDGAITANAEGSAWNHFEYDSFWDAAARIDGRGWSAEMRIPLTSLRFRRGPDGSVTMGVITGRFIARSGERHVFPDIRPGPPVAHYKPSLAAPLRLTGVEDRTPLYIRPYVLAGAEREVSGLAGGNALIREVGGDAKIGVASNLTLDLTVNTDFAQTEIDDAQINLTRYGLLVPEKRSFFLERSGTFTLDAGPDVRLFHSRRIGLGATGSPERVLGGARLVGRVGAWDVGVLDLQTDAAGGAGTSNAAVVRARRSLGGADSYVGAMVTSSTRGARPVAAGVDGTVRVVGDDYLGFAAGVTPTRSGGVSLDDALGRFLLERRNRRGWFYRGELATVGSGFDPALGFVRRGGLTTHALMVGHGRFGGTELQSRLVSVEATLARRHGSGSVESGMVALTWTAERRGGGRGQVDLAWRHEGLLDAFALGSASVPAGAHRFVEGRASVETPNGRALWSTVEVGGGAFYDGWRISASAMPTWTVSRHVRVVGGVEASRVWFPSRSERYTAWVTRLRMLLSPDTRLSVNVLVQHSSATGVTGGNVRFRYMFAEGDDAYLVFTAGRSGMRDDTAPTDLRSRSSVVLKYSKTVR